MIPAKENLIQFLIFNLIFAMLKPFGVFTTNYFSIFYKQ